MIHVAIFSAAGAALLVTGLGWLEWVAQENRGRRRA